MRLYQVVDIQSSSESGDGDDDDDVVMVEDEGSRRKIAYIVSPMTHLTLQSKQQNDKGTNGFGLTWRLPRPSFALTCGGREALCEGTKGQRKVQKETSVEGSERKRRND